MLKCNLCGRELVYEGLVSQECTTSSCPNFSETLRATPPPPEEYSGWDYDHYLGLWRKREVY